LRSGGWTTYHGPEGPEGGGGNKTPKDIKVYDDAIVSIKTEGLIGDMFLSIDAGGAGKLLDLVEPLPKRSRLWTS